MSGVVTTTLEHRMARYQQMIALRDVGKTYEEIGEAVGLSRQRVAGILDQGPPKAIGRPRKAEAVPR